MAETLAKVAEKKPGITITIRNPEVVRRMVDRLEEASREMQSINVSFTPIKYHTKDRWQSVVDDAADMLSRFIGHPALHAGKEE